MTAPARRRPAPALRVGSALRWTWIALVVGVVVFPVWVTVATAVSPPGRTGLAAMFPAPGDLTLDNVRTALAGFPLVRQFGVSVMVTALQTTAQVVLAAAAAYALVLPTWRGRTVAFVLILGTLAIPGESSVIPNFQLVSSLGLRNTVLGIVLPFLAVGYPVFLLRQAFGQLPREVWEAARLDGASHLRCLTRVVVPMTAPQVVTAALWCALAAWNGYFWPLLITDTPEQRTVQVGLAQLAAGESTTPAVVYAGTLVVLLPTLLLVLVGQRFLVRGLATRAR